MNESNLHNYQNGSVDHIIYNPYCGLFLDMGLGKTVSTLTAINKLIFEEVEIDTVLIIAPKRVVESVWDAEIEKWDHLKRLTITKIIGTEKQRKAKLKEKTFIHIISRDNIAWLCGQYGGHLPYNMLVVDESSSFKSPKSQRFKALKLAQPSFSRVVILTGTPAPNGLIDLWSQIYLLDRGERLGKTITQYREVYFTPNKRNGAVIFNYKLQNDGEERIHAKIQDVCMSMKAKDYLDLPDRINNYIEIDFSEELRKKYDDFERDQVLELLNSGKEITVANTAALNNKLLQFANGAIYDENRDYHVIHDLKLEAAEEIVENANGKPVLIAYAYKHDAERLLERLKKYKPVLLKDDNDIKKWNRGEIQVLIMHPASGGHGLNLQYGGNILLWFGLTWSLELYMQLNSRLDRQGQIFNVIVNHLMIKGTWDEKVIKALEEKDYKQDLLMEAVKSAIKKWSKLMQV